MAKALGIGGVFFKADNPDKLADWYSDCLQIEMEPVPCAAFKPAGLPAGGYTVWAPFNQSTDYFNPSAKDFMINLIVDDLEEALEQVRNAGGQVMEVIEESEYGRFGWFLDPEGNKIELWVPPKP